MYLGFLFVQGRKIIKRQRTLLKVETLKILQNKSSRSIRASIMVDKVAMNFTLEIIDNYDEYLKRNISVNNIFLIFQYLP